MATFRVAGASEYLAITGWGIDDIKLAKKAWVWLGQRCKMLDVAPASYEVVAQGVTSESFPVVVRAVYTVGPNIDTGEKRPDKDPLLLYAKLVAPPSKKEGCSSRVKELVQGALDRHVGALAAGMTLEQIFVKGRKSFAEEILDRVQLDLGMFGIYVYNANVKKLSVDVPASKYLADVHKTSQLGAATGFPVQMVVEGNVDAKKKLIKADEQHSKAAVANDTQQRYSQEGNAAWHTYRCLEQECAKIMSAATQERNASWYAYRFFEQEWAKFASAATQERGAICSLHAHRCFEQEWAKFIGVAMEEARKAFVDICAGDASAVTLWARRLFRQEILEIASAGIDNARKAFAVFVAGDAQGAGVQEQQTGVAAPAESNQLTMTERRRPAASPSSPVFQMVLA
ncbi:hypothetical protein EJB05_32378, partial [Eragrostis curvula]